MITVYYILRFEKLKLYRKNDINSKVCFCNFQIKSFLKQNFCFYPNLKKDPNTLFHRDTTVIWGISSNNTIIVYWKKETNLRSLLIFKSLMRSQSVVFESNKLNNLLKHVLEIVILKILMGQLSTDVHNFSMYHKQWITLKIILKLICVFDSALHT